MRSLHWFQRRRIGLGWRPATWQGWLITVVALGGMLSVLTGLHRSGARIPIAIAIFAVYAIVARATGGGSRLAEAEAAPEAGGASEQDALRPRTVVQPTRVKPIGARRPPSSGAPVIEVEHLTKRFADRLAVDDVSFSVGAGEVFGFLGPNGAGKTTTVRMLATLLEPSAGTARIGGLSLGRDTAMSIRKQIAVMTESPGLYLRLTVAENLEFFAGLYELDRPRERIVRALQAVDLGHRAGDACGSLSKGLRQRVALARTLLSEPAVVFLDEPTSGLDPVASRDVHTLIDGLRDQGVTVFLTTHRLEEAERLCDRVAILNTSLRTIGRPDELRDRLFNKSLVVRTAAPLPAPDAVFAVPGVDGWHVDDTGRYVLRVDDARVAAPGVTRALVTAGADVLSLGEVRHSLEDVYLELVDDKE